MKKILFCLLTVVLLLSLAVTAYAAPEEDIPETSQGNVIIITDEADLPEGYEIDFSMEITLNSEEGWSSVLKDLFNNADGDYIYIVSEVNIAEGYNAYYSIDLSNSENGNVVIVRNVKEGNPPIYQLPKTGSEDTVYYTVAVASVFLAIVVYGMFIRQKHSENEV